MNAVAPAIEPVLTSVAERKSAVDALVAFPATGGSILDREDVKAVVADVEAEAQERICVCVARKIGSCERRLAGC